jgi:hypothetical protein
MKWLRNISISFFCFAVVNMAAAEGGTVDKLIGDATNTAQKLKDFTNNVVFGVIAVVAGALCAWEWVKASRGKSQVGWPGVIGLGVISFVCSLGGIFS